MARRVKTFQRLALVAGLSLAALPALAGQAVTLKAETLDSDGMVTFGDLFDGAGAAGAIAVAAKPGASVTLDAAALQTAARRAGLDWANAEGFRRIIVRGGAAAGPSSPAAAQRGNVEILTYARSLATGEIVQPQDLVWAKAAAAPADAPADAANAIGLAAKRPLRAGAAVSARDLGAAMVVKAGEIITVTYENAGITLSLQGKALAAAAVGESFSVQNPASKKTVQAVATGPGQAVVGPTADRFRSQRQSQFAFR